MELNLIAKPPVLQLIKEMTIIVYKVKFMFSCPFKCPNFAWYNDMNIRNKLGLIPCSLVSK
jgi:hypothetical protein